MNEIQEQGGYDDHANHLIKDEYEPLKRENSYIPEKPIAITGDERDILRIAQVFGIDDVPRYAVLWSLLEGDTLDDVAGWVERAREAE